MNADERRFIARAYIALVRLFLSVALCKNLKASPQSAQSPQRDGGAGVREDGGRGSACLRNGRGEWIMKGVPLA